jgi:hypothetical protein
MQLQGAECAARKFIGGSRFSHHSSSHQFLRNYYTMLLRDYQLFSQKQIAKPSLMSSPYPLWSDCISGLVVTL